MFTVMPGERARTALSGTRFSDVRWVAETASTNADALALAYDGADEGVVVVADHQTAGRGRLGRSWSAPPSASLLLSVLLRPPATALGGTTIAAAVAMAEAVEQVAGFEPRLKWPNDLVWADDDAGPDRKLAGILAEVDWPVGADIAAGWRAAAPSERAVVVVGIGVNVNWPADLVAAGLPAEVSDVAVAANQVVGHDLDREDLLIAFLRAFDHRYRDLLAGGAARSAVFAAWRARSATLGRRVRVDLGVEDVVGTAFDVTDDGHLVVETGPGERRTFAVGDVVHLR